VFSEAAEEQYQLHAQQLPPGQQNNAPPVQLGSGNRTFDPAKSQTLRAIHEEENQFQGIPQQNYYSQITYQSNGPNAPRQTYYQQNAPQQTYYSQQNAPQQTYYSQTSYQQIPPQRPHENQVFYQQNAPQQQNYPQFPQNQYNQYQQNLSESQASHQHFC
jgi:hypothetical protein